MEIKIAEIVERDGSLHIYFPNACSVTVLTLRGLEGLFDETLHALHSWTGREYPVKPVRQSQLEWLSSKPEKASPEQ